MFASRVTLNDIARATGLSRSGVSRALRNDPRVPAATCERVQAIARKLGYRPDPELSAALRLLRERKAGRYVETLAFLSWHEDRIERAGNLYTRRLFHGARTHAEALGYRLEEYWAREPGMTPRRLQSVLVNRGVRGVLAGPVADEDSRTFAFAWERFSVVAATAAFPDVTMHRARPRNFENSRLALAEAHALGYRRIGLMLDDYVNERSAHAIRSAYLDYQYTRAGLPRLPVLELCGLGPDPGPESARAPEAEPEYKRFAAWRLKHRPDVILASRVVFYEWLRRARLRVPEEVGFISLEGVNEGQAFSHIDQHPDRVGAAGIDLLIAVLNHNTRGVPGEALMVTVAGAWVPGASTRRQPPHGAASSTRRSRAASPVLPEQQPE
ncbi:LacI family transcriptional regulator [Opitutaceae bacterium TAV5]|nr:LacI family transcriptional regulator [Opitutaceae bacterium TAV5]